VYPAKEHEDSDFTVGKVDLRGDPRANRWNEYLASKVWHSMAFPMRPSALERWANFTSHSHVLVLVEIASQPPYR
jgi:hypothetical protein